MESSISLIKLGQEKCQAIIGLHIFTRCDSISAFMGKGKTNPLGLMLESEAFCSAFIALRSGWEALDNIIPDVVHSVLTERFCWCNVERYTLFRLTCRSEALPPYQDC